jgi:hypothetical protein
MSRGSDFIKAVLAEHEPTIAERVLLEEVGATLDALTDPELGDTAKRQHRLILSRLLAQLDIRGEDDEKVFVDGVSVRAQRASNIRWRREKAAS